MSYERTKEYARSLGLYRAARWVHRNVMDRTEGQAFGRELSFYGEFLKPGTLCFDVGANYGRKVEIFLKLGARVVAFEPQQDCMAELRSRSGHNPRLTTVPAAVGSSRGSLTLYIGAHRTTSSFNKDWHEGVVGSVEVPVITLDDAIADHGTPEYCKIDVEGFEIEVLRGLNRPIPLVSFEYHLRDNGTQAALDCLDRLAALGTISVNVTPAEDTVFSIPEWLSVDDFRALLVNEIPKMRRQTHGDIFVRTR
jgi:FkbM family methyltransferase